MKVMVQRVSKASVEVNGKIVGQINNGLLLLIGIAENDTTDVLNWMVDKCVNLRIFEDEKGIMNRSLININAEILAISQFTLLADTRKGRRPSYIQAASPEKGEKFYNLFIQMLREYNLKVETGVFGAMMNVELTNRGPVTLMIEK